MLTKISQNFEFDVISLEERRKILSSFCYDTRYYKFIKQITLRSLLTLCTLDFFLTIADNYKERKCTFDNVTCV